MTHTADLGAIHPARARHVHEGRSEHVLVWQLVPSLRAIASAPLGGGVGMRHWVVNAQVPTSYARIDVEDHLAEIAGAHGCAGDGIGMLTATDLDRMTVGSDHDVTCFATVGLGMPTWAADADDASSPQWRPGTINVVVFAPVALADGALVNAVMTVTEAKVQALHERAFPGTGTASDAVCVLCPTAGRPEPFGGPRSPVGARIARAVHAAVAAGVAAWSETGS